MSGFFNKRVLPIGLSVLSLAVSTLAFAAANDEFLSTDATGVWSSNLHGEAGYDLMNSTVDVFNLRTRQGPVPDNAGDYRGGHLSLGYKWSPHWATEATYWKRDIVYGTSTNQIDSWLLALYYDPLAEPHAQDRAIFRFSVWGDQASELSKKSPTLIGSTTFNQINVQNPTDIQAQVDAIFSNQFNERNKFTGFVSAGLSSVDVGDINANIQKGKCNFNVGISSDNIANGTLAAPCQVGNNQVQSASFSVSSLQYGVDINKDMVYRAGFLGLGGSWRWTYERWTSNVGYQFQYIKRNNVDKQVSQFGGSPLRTNQTIGVDVAYKINNKVDVFVQGQAFKSNFVGSIPFLYNAVTASRLNRYYGLTTFGVRFTGF